MEHSLSTLVAWTGAAPRGTLIDVAELHAQLVAISARAIEPTTECATISVVADQPNSWRERIWTTPAETRMGVVEVAEAIGRPKSFVYRHTAKNAGDSRLPHRRLDGELQFVAGEIRTWLSEHEEIVCAGRMSPPRALRRAS